MVRHDPVPLYVHGTCSLFQSDIIGFNSVLSLKYQLPHSAISDSRLNGSGRLLLDPLREPARPAQSFKDVHQPPPLPECRNNEREGE